MEDNFKWTDELVSEFCNYFRNIPFGEVIKENQFKKFKELKSKKQSVENKDWEMVDGLKKCIDGYWTGEVLVRTIRRLSDNETFSIDELTQAGNKIQSFEETKFGLLANMGSFKVPVEDLVKRKIDNKDWEILSFKGEWGGHKDVEFNFNPYNGFYIPEHAMPTYGEYKYTVSDLLKEEAKIHSVKRLSDNSVWSVEDEFYNNGAGIYTEEKIKSFSIVDDALRVYPHEGGYYLIQHLHKKQPLFTTEDNVPIYEGDEYAYVPKETLAWVNVSDGYSTPQPKESFLYFSSKAKANDYILMNKPCLSLKDIEGLVEWERKYHGSNPIDTIYRISEKANELVKRKQ